MSFKKRAFKSLLAFILAQLAHALAFAAVVDTPSTTIRAWSIFLSASAVTLVGNTGSQKLSLLPVVLGSTGGSVLALLLASAGWPEKAYMCQSVCAVLAAYFYTRDRNGQQESIVPGGRCAHALLISMLQSSLIIVAAASLIQVRCFVFA